MMESDGIANEGAGHASSTTAAPAQLVAGDREYLDAVVSQEAVGDGVAFVSDDHARRQRKEVVGVVPLLPRCSAFVIHGAEHLDGVALQDLCERGVEVGSRLEGEAARPVGSDDPHPQRFSPEVRIRHERIDIDHREDGVEMHG